MTARYTFEHLHQPDGWMSPAYVEVDDDGRIRSVAAEPPESWPPTPVISGYAVPGLPNLHSHAFQRALAGLTEANVSGRDDDFWTWRTTMYALANAVSPEELEAIAAQLYLEMLEAGMTAVGEFHYLHHNPSGVPYDARSELAMRVLSAAETVGMPITLLPVLYQQGGFDEPAGAHQRRFVHDSVDQFLRMVESLAPALAVGGRANLGIAPHSLRALSPDALDAAVRGFRAQNKHAPIHIHIAEQRAEVDQCLAARGARPVDWLFGRDLVDPTWCFVHATHISDSERIAVAASGVTVGLCPTTEANLGDGLFPARDYLGEGGAFGVGSDSHVSVSATEELRLLEYGQRLNDERRNRLVGDSGRDLHVGRFLWDHAVAGGASALGQLTGSLVPGMLADVVVLDAEHPRLCCVPIESVLDAFIFGGADAAVREVYAGGVRVVSEGRHARRDEVRTAFSAAMKSLLGRL